MGTGIHGRIKHNMNGEHNVHDLQYYVSLLPLTYSSMNVAGAKRIVEYRESKPANPKRKVLHPPQQ